jgi:hypothetical protein
MKDVIIDKTKSVQWSILVDNLKIATYEGCLYDKNNVLLMDPWLNQRTDDSQPDVFNIEDGLNLDLAVVHVLGDAFDPSMQGGQYNATLEILQEGNVIGQNQHPGKIPAGKGQIDSFVIEITLHTT